MMATAMATTTKAHDHPPYKEMIVSAIESLKERKGSSKTAIAKYIASNYNDLPPTHDALLGTHLRRLKQKGILQMVKHSYKLGELNNGAHSGPKKRGRPPKKSKPDNADVGPSEKRKPGRPKKVVGEENLRAGRPKKELAPKKEKSADVAASGEKRKPGRPKKALVAVENGGGSKLGEKRKSGRAKKALGSVENGGGSKLGEKRKLGGEKRKPGRPKKALGGLENGGGRKLGEKRKPGRPKKESTPSSGPLVATKRLGRPPKEEKPAVVAKTGSGVKRSVGRPRKNVEA